MNALKLFGRWHLLALNFFIGVIVMALEVSGFRLLAPFFGYSIYVSGGLIGVILIAMSGGYLLGGVLCKKNAPQHLNIVMLISTGTFLASLVFYKWILSSLLGWGETAGSVA